MMEAHKKAIVSALNIALNNKQKIVKSNRISDYDFLK
jgi:hypothetical protein